MSIDEALAARAAAGERLSEADLHALLAADLLALGALADEARRARRGDRVSYVRVYVIEVCRAVADGVAVPAGAGEVRLEGLPETMEAAVAAVRAARRAAGDRLVSGFSLDDLMARTGAGWGSLDRVLAGLRAAGLDAVSEIPADRLGDLTAGVAAVRGAGLLAPRVTVEGAAGVDIALLLRVRALQDTTGALAAFAPLPRRASAAAPTTGYQDVRAVALARLALDNVPSIQVDWARYGPKLAQVALTFGADDLDAVSPADESALGWRRAPVEEVRRNVQAAGLQAVERDGRFRPSRL